MSQTAIRYRVQPDSPNTHTFTVSLWIAEPAAEGQKLSLPTWLPGSYMIRDFARHITQISAADAQGKPLPLTKLDKQTWQLGKTTGPVTITSRIYALDMSVRAAFLDTSRGFFNGSSLFLAVEGQEECSCEMELLPATGAQFSAWQVATAMQPQQIDAAGYGVYQAENYAELIDHPVELGEFERYSFDVQGIPHQLVVSGIHQGDMQRLVEDLIPICEYELALFGEPYPLDRYLFLLNIVGNGYGGLEHRNSTALIASRNDLPVAGEQQQSDEYRNLLGLCSHEYFHNWNVKRIKPVEFEPFDLSQEVYTKQLWAYEGITSYYDELILLRSGVISAQDYLNMLATTLNRVMRGTGRLKQSIAESSFDAWTRFYKQDENAANAIVSYYTKGAMFALYLDLYLRQATNSTTTLDDVMQQLWRDYGSVQRPTQFDTITEIVLQLAKLDIQPLIQRFLFGTEDIPLQPLLEQQGIAVSRPSTQDHISKGAPAEKPQWGIGALSETHALGVRLKVVYEDEAACDAGLAPGDILVALDNMRVTQAELGNILKRAAGAPLQVHYFRRDQLLTTQLTPQTGDARLYQLTLTDKADTAWFVK